MSQYVWELQISRFFASFPGVAKALDAYGPAGASTPAEDKDDDSDFGDDLFGDSDSEEDEEMKKRLEEYKAKKAKSNTSWPTFYLYVDRLDWGVRI